MDYRYIRVISNHFKFVLLGNGGRPKGSSPVNNEDFYGKEKGQDGKYKWVERKAVADVVDRLESKKPVELKPHLQGLVEEELAIYPQDYQETAKRNNHTESVVTILDGLGQNNPFIRSLAVDLEKTEETGKFVAEGKSILPSDEQDVQIIKLQQDLEVVMQFLFKKGLLYEFWDYAKK